MLVDDNGRRHRRSHDDILKPAHGTPQRTEQGEHPFGARPPDTHSARDSRISVMVDLRPEFAEGPKCAILFFFFKGDGNIRIGGQANPITFNIRNEAARNEVVMPFVGPFTAILLCELDPASFDAVDRPDMHAVGTNDFHMLSDFLHDSLLNWTR